MSEKMGQTAWANSLDLSAKYAHDVAEKVVKVRGWDRVWLETIDNDIAAARAKHDGGFVNIDDAFDDIPGFWDDLADHLIGDMSLGDTPDGWEKLIAAYRSGGIAGASAAETAYQNSVTGKVVGTVEATVEDIGNAAKKAKKAMSSKFTWGAAALVGLGLLFGRGGR